MPSFHFDHSWTKKELKDECRMRGISYYGLNKDDLVDELNSHVDHSWTKKKLQAECRIRGITYCGLNKDGLVHELNYSSRSGELSRLPINARAFDSLHDWCHVRTDFSHIFRKV